MAKAIPFENLTLSPVAQKTIELALRSNQTPETLLFAVIASQEGDPLLVVERREGAIRAAGRGAQSTPKALDQEGINRFAQQVNDFGESTDVVALGIIHPQSGLAPSPTELHSAPRLSDGEVDLLELVRNRFPQATWQLIADMTKAGPTVTASKKNDFFSRQSAVLPNEPQTPIEFTSSKGLLQRDAKPNRR